MGLQEKLLLLGQYYWHALNPVGWVPGIEWTDHLVGRPVVLYRLANQIPEPKSLLPLSLPAPSSLPASQPASSGSLCFDFRQAAQLK